MDPLKTLNELVKKIQSGTASPTEISDFLSRYGTWLERAGMGEWVDKLGGEYDRLVKGGAGQEAPKSVVGAAALGAGQGAWTGVQNVLKFFAAPFDPKTPTPAWVKWVVGGVAGVAIIVVVRRLT